VWTHRKLELTQEEVDRLLPLVKRSAPHFERLRDAEKLEDAPQMPRELSKALRETTFAIAAAHGYDNARVGWSYDGETVSVSVEIPDEQADSGA